MYCLLQGLPTPVHEGSGYNQVCWKRHVESMQNLSSFSPNGTVLVSLSQDLTWIPIRVPWHPVCGESSKWVLWKIWQFHLICPKILYRKLKIYFLPSIDISNAQRQADQWNSHPFNGRRYNKILQPPVLPFIQENKSWFPASISALYLSKQSFETRSS